MFITTSHEMRELDRRASEEYGIPSLVLMENAGLRLFEEAKRLLDDKSRGKRVLVFAGKGNNGGDGFVAARHLMNSGAEVKVFLLARPEDIKGDARINLNILQKSGGRIYSLTEEKDLQRADISLLYADLVIDAIFGTGFQGKATGISSLTIQMINASGKKVIAADLPSGLEANTGKVHGPCVKATSTVTFGLPKIGLFLEPGAGYTGKVFVGDISFPKQLTEESNLKRSLITRKWCEERLPRRLRDTHKGNYGKVVIIGGSQGMTGAAVLAARGALRAGAGLVYLGLPASLQALAEMKATEVITFGLPETPEATLSKDAYERIVELVPGSSVIAVGPGMGRHSDSIPLLRKVISNTRVPVVVDADGLNALAEDMDMLDSIRVPLILTPHPGEMARLTKMESSDVQKNRLKVVEEASRHWGAVVVLKGARTLVASPAGQTFINVTGNPGMATGGTGDVLTGVIAAFIGQGLVPLEAAALAAYIHGAAGDYVSLEKGERGLTAEDLVEHLPFVLRALEKIGDESDASCLGRSEPDGYKT